MLSSYTVHQHVSVVIVSMLCWHLAQITTVQPHRVAGVYVDFCLETDLYQH